ncbi:hypothetical protein HA402_008634, partial [Bradysia odoriphaga]
TTPQKYQEMQILMCVTYWYNAGEQNNGPVGHSFLRVMQETEPYHLPSRTASCFNRCDIMDNWKIFHRIRTGSGIRQ